MSHAFVRTVCRLLVVCLACLPFQSQAGMIGAGDAVAAAQAQADDASAARSGLIGKLQEYGLASEQARERVASLTDAEVLAIADRVADAPAGALSGAGIGALLVILFLIWRFTFGAQDKK